MENSYRNRYFSNRNDISSNKYSTTSNLFNSMRAFTNSKAYRNIESENQIMSTNSSNINTPLLYKSSTRNLQQDSSVISDKYNSKSNKIDCDEFAIFGTTRMLSTVKSTQERPNINDCETSHVRVTFNLENQQNDKAESPYKSKQACIKTNELFSEIMPNTILPSVEERETFITSKEGEASFKEFLQSRETTDCDRKFLYLGERDSFLTEKQESPQTNNIKDYKRLLEKIDILKKKLSLYKTELLKLRNQSSENDKEEEVEIETFTETTTKVIPSMKKVEHRIEASKMFLSAGIQCEDIYYARKGEFKDICTEENLIEVIDVTGDSNGKETLQEWMTESDENYSYEQRNVIEHLFQMFETNRTEFVKLIVNLLARRVKTVAVQSDVFEVTERAINTDICRRESVACGDSNTINVTVTELTRLKSIHCQVRPECFNKFTSPMSRIVSNEATSTQSLIGYLHAEVDYGVSMRESGTQTCDQQARTMQDSVAIPDCDWSTDITNQSADIDQGTMEQRVSSVATKTDSSTQRKYLHQSISNNRDHHHQNRSQSSSFHLDHLKYQLSPRFDRQLTKNRLERYEILNSRRPYHSVGRTSRRSNYVPITFSHCQSSNLTRFNDFMKVAILRAPDYSDNILHATNDEEDL